MSPKNTDSGDFDLSLNCQHGIVSLNDNNRIFDKSALSETVINSRRLLSDTLRITLKHVRL